MLPRKSSIELERCTGEENRDGHLKSPEFFDVEQHPQIAFKTTAVESDDDGTIRLAGNITIKGITRPIELTGTAGEGGADPWGKERIGFEVEGKIDRRDFDLKWNQTLPNGNVLVSNEVKLQVSVSAVKES
jgi:polyisoprenoid-binding protein YceI